MLGGTTLTAETADCETAWIFLQFGAAWVAAGTAGLYLLQTWRRQRAIAHALYSALAINLGFTTICCAIFTPLFLIPAAHTLTGLILLEFFCIALPGQLWLTCRHFQQRWHMHREVALARYVDTEKAAVAIVGLSRALFLRDDMVLPGWPERVRMAVQLLAGIALLLGLGLYDLLFEAALPAGGFATVCVVTYLLQRSLVPLLLAGKLRQLEKEIGRPIRLMSDSELAIIVARARREKKRGKR